MEEILTLESKNGYPSVRINLEECYDSLPCEHRVLTDSGESFFVSAPGIKELFLERGLEPHPHFCQCTTIIDIFGDDPEDCAPVTYKEDCALGRLATESQGVTYEEHCALGRLATDSQGVTYEEHCARGRLATKTQGVTYEEHCALVGEKDK
jgi:hypothetical protein